MTYFKKYDLKIPLADGMGRRVPFQDVGGQWGLLATEENYLIGELRKCQREARGGVMEITAQEYEELKKKQKPISSRIWREVVGHLRLKRMLDRVNASVAAAGRISPIAKSQIAEAKALVRPQGISDLVPKGIKR